MSHSYRHYRQVQIINNTQDSSPQIDGFEEIVCDGKRQVYYWNKPTDRPRWDDSDFILSSLLDADSNGLDSERFSSRVRYLNPHEVVIRDLTYPQTKIKQQNSKFSQLKKSIQKRVNNFKKNSKAFTFSLQSGLERVNQ
ncbi:hypothetical protein [Cyanothece sp. BG0011]|uniref:hypothetical protein n=1 Tax=Cyanothece sp. BG0011 TaxID=2082950 RepID=UPI0018E51FDA|nr:hypothetical protein [Cyanothece sp. BG0011]